MIHCESWLKSRLPSSTCRIRFTACIRLRRRRLNRLCEGRLGNRCWYSRRQLNSSVSMCQPRHSPIKVMAINSLSLQTGDGPGRSKKGATAFQMSSTITYTQVQKSSNSVIIRLSSLCEVEFGDPIFTTVED